MNSADKIYAQALLETSNEGKISRDAVKKDLAVISDAVNNSSDLYSVLTSPSVSFDKKRLIFNDVFSKNISSEVLNFVNLIIEKNKFDTFENIVSAFLELADAIDGIKHVKIYSALELSDGLKEELKEKLDNKLSKNSVPEWIVDEDIIGGLIIKYDDNVIDMSIKGKLDKIMKGNV